MASIALFRSALARFADAGLDSIVLMDDGVQDPLHAVDEIAALARETGYLSPPS